MNSREPKSPFVTILQALVVGLILIFNAAMTAVFGWDNLAAAFGGETIMPRFAGAFYALLIFDLAAVAYLLVYRRNSFTQWQRHVALAMAVICLLGSISATVAQLANTAFGLDAWAEYKSGVESTSLVFMIGLTAVHAVVAATFSLMGNEGRLTDKAIATIAKVSDTAFAAAVKQIEEEDNAVLVETIKVDIRTAILNQLGFTKDLKQIGAAPGLGFGSKTATAVPASPGDQPKATHYTIDFYSGKPVWRLTFDAARSDARTEMNTHGVVAHVYDANGRIVETFEPEESQPARPTPLPYGPDTWYTIAFTNRSGKPWSYGVASDDLEEAKKAARRTASEGCTNVVVTDRQGNVVWEVPVVRPTQASQNGRSHPQRPE